VRAGSAVRCRQHEGPSADLAVIESCEFNPGFRASVTEWAKTVPILTRKRAGGLS
jgi:hypothetical protein